MTTEQSVATARRFLRHRLVANLVTLVVGGLLLATGTAGLACLGAQTDQLASTGIHASANVTAVDNYRSRFQFDEHIDVSFRIAGVVVVARCYTGPGDVFTIGEPVAIVYDTANPLHAQLADGPDPGPISAPFIGALLLGVLIVLPGGVGLFVRRGVRPALRAPARPMTATRSTWRRMTLRGEEVRQTLWMHGQLRKFGTEPVPTQAFGQPDRATIVVVEPATGAVAFGRMRATTAEEPEQHRARVDR